MVAAALAMRAGSPRLNETGTVSGLLALGTVNKSPDLLSTGRRETRYGA